MSLISRVADRLSRWRHTRSNSPTRKEWGSPQGSTSDSANVQAQFRLGIEHYNSRNYQDAIECFEAAIALSHDFADAHYYLALALYQFDRFEEAADTFSMALCFAPTMSKAWLGLAHAERMQGKAELALSTLEQLLAQASSADAYNLRGAILLEKGDVAAASVSFERAVEQNPNGSLGHGNLGYVLFRELGEYERGAKHVERALELDPGNEDARCNYSMILFHYGEDYRALALCDQLLSSNPQMHEARLNRALVLLRLGKYEQAWDDYEARKLVRSNFNARNFSCPEWQGEDLGGKTVLVHGEQGLGDEIMFASCFHEVIGRAGRCVIECEPRLQQLFKRSFGKATIVASQQTAVLPAWWADESGIDVRIAAGSLPRQFRRNATAFPRHHGYLRPNPDRTAYWRDRLAGIGPGLKVGISWRGGMPSTRRELRSIDLAAWARVLRTHGAQFVSLQYGDIIGELQRLKREQAVDLHCWQEAIDDLDEAAALISGLDVVISVCTAVIHLTGALGRPVWVLVPTSPEWRYLAEGSSMPWYPSARLYRQRAQGEWQPVLDEVAADLERLFAQAQEGADDSGATRGLNG